MSANLRFDPAVEQVGRLSLDERLLLSIESKRQAHRPAGPTVIPLAFVSRAERDMRDIAAERRDFIEKTTDDLLKDRDSFGALLMELIADDAMADMAVVALRDAYEEQGKCWDGIAAFGDLVHGLARRQAAGKWPAKLAELKPLCCECAHAKYDRGGPQDQGGYYCKLDFCLWSE